MSPSFTPAAALALALFAGPRSAAAQADTTTVPRPLVTALLTSGYGGNSDARVVVGSPPPGWPSSLIPPPPAIAVGGMVSGPDLIAVFQDTTKRFLLDYLNQVELLGWTPPPTRPLFADGFQSGGFSGAGFRDGSYCRDQSRIRAVAAPGAMGGTFIHVTYARTDGSCTYRPPEPRSSWLVLPALPPPQGARMIGGGGVGRGSEETNTRVRLQDSTRNAPAMLAHFAGLLVASG